MAKVASAASPITTNQNAAVLAKEGIRLTLGRMRGWLKALEDKSHVHPVRGDIIQGARKEGDRGFQPCRPERATLRVGMKLDIGVQDAGKPSVKPMTRCSPSHPRMRWSRNSFRTWRTCAPFVSNLPQREQWAFDGIIAREFDDGTRVAPEWAYQRGNLQAVKRGLDAAVDRFSKPLMRINRNSAGPEAGPAGILDLIARSNPQKRSRTATVNKAYANFKRIQRAASSVANPDGFYPCPTEQRCKSPGQVEGQAGVFGGTALMQDLTRPCKASNALIDSRYGTAGRTLANIMNPINWPEWW